MRATQKTAALALADSAAKLLAWGDALPTCPAADRAVIRELIAMERRTLARLIDTVRAGV